MMNDRMNGECRLPVVVSQLPGQTKVVTEETIRASLQTTRGLLLEIGKRVEGTYPDHIVSYVPIVRVYNSQP